MMQRVEDLPPPIDPWVARMYAERPDLARRLDQWCIDLSAACGTVFARDSGPARPRLNYKQLRSVIASLHERPESEWQKILDDNDLLTPAEIRLLETNVYNEETAKYPGLRDRIHAWMKEHRDEYTTMPRDPDRPGPAKKGGPGRGYKKGS